VLSFNSGGSHFKVLMEFLFSFIAMPYHPFFLYHQILFPSQLTLLLNAFFLHSFYIICMSIILGHPPMLLINFGSVINEIEITILS
jgi:hypothetical protein